MTSWTRSSPTWRRFAEGDDGRERGGSSYCEASPGRRDRKSTRLNSSHVRISYAVFCLKKKKTQLSSNDLHQQYPGLCQQQQNPDILTHKHVQTTHARGLTRRQYTMKHSRCQ